MRAVSVPSCQLCLRDCVDLTKFLPGWFLNTPVAFLSYNDIREFVSFGFYYR